MLVGRTNVLEIVLVDGRPVARRYAVVSRVESGAEVVDKIRVAQTGNKGGMQNVPLEPITIQSATVVAK